ncbi:MAG: hypothetical protein HY819_00345 [Acidobacteria bacterium]|nr:hypothetical protein [Acidobacteriota bacterium]
MSRSRSDLPSIQNNSAAVNVKITGFWRWKTVVIPPNAYVVHTRRGYSEPLHLGMGVSFSFNPYLDSFIVVPSTMQTILINADCICKELQGLLVQGYVQWIIEDFSTAYKKLDFSDPTDPMRMVNVQLREQAEAAIKDKVATMSIDEVLSDKQPIIEELTTRLRQVAEGGGNANKGLGLSIVTVQIKEAVVSSANLWENLQKPFRAERQQRARLAELDAQSVIQARELEQETARTTSQIENDSQLAQLRSEKDAQVFDREQIEKVRRQQKEQEVTRQIIIEQNITSKQEQEAKRQLEELNLKNTLLIETARMQAKHEEFLKENELRIAQLSKEIESANSIAELDKVRLEKESELTILKASREAAQKEIVTKAELALQELMRVANNRQTQVEIEFETARQKILNNMSSNHLGAQLIETLPSIVEKLPKPKELRTVSIGTNSQPIETLATLIAQILEVMNTFKVAGKEKNE